MKQKIFLLTPPFTQLNTPYPATAYLKGYLNTLGYPTTQCDLGIEVILNLFTKKGLQDVFNEVGDNDISFSENTYRIFNLKEAYYDTIEPVIHFLQHKDPTLAHLICAGDYLPTASRFKQLEGLDWAFGTLGIQDKARHFATLYLEDLGDFIREAVDPQFGFSRYAEKLSASLSSFDDMEQAIENPETVVTAILLDILLLKINVEKPTVICISVPFPGNLFAAFKCGQFIKKYFPDIKIVMGGGYPNTELRRLSDERVFKYIDYICLDDGELPLKQLLRFLDGETGLDQLKRTFLLENGVVSYRNNPNLKDIPQREVGTPDYSDLILNDYLSVIEVINPMHRLWNDGRWNKLTLAHGCYWGKCTFCDVTLDYIKRYEPLTASLLCDKIETIIQQTNQTGFHFVDEAAPPALMRDLAIEIIRRKLTISWWTNIRFEKSFTADLCQLLKASGCIAISAGLEVASDRLLTQINKGVTVAQVAKVSENFSEVGIMVHAYLMYGFPTQTAQETINSLEMVRQLFEAGIVQSGFWHRFSMTTHAPVGLAPEVFGAIKVEHAFGGFAENDLEHQDPTGADHTLFKEGLEKSLYNYMHGYCLDYELKEWFDFEIPPTSIDPEFIEKALIELTHEDSYRPNDLIIWLGNAPIMDIIEIEDGNKIHQLAYLTFITRTYDFSLETPLVMGKWLMELFSSLTESVVNPMRYKVLEKKYNLFHAQNPQMLNFELFKESYIWEDLRKNGLLVL